MISLIMATIGRRDEIELFMDSLDAQTEKDFELIVVDQNTEGFLDGIFDKERRYPVKHIVSNKKGLSKNRNLGIMHANGDILAFPDDDCTYYPETLSAVVDTFNATNSNMVVGRIWDRKKSVDIIKSWPKKDHFLKRGDLYAISSSITFFCKNYGQKFEELLGAGSKYPSNEDFHYIAEFFEKHGGLYYTPLVDVWHPEQSYKNIPLVKAFDYGRGFGYCAKILSQESIYYKFLFIQAISYHGINCLLGMAFSDFLKSKYSFAAFRGRLRGWREAQM